MRPLVILALSVALSACGGSEASNPDAGEGTGTSSVGEVGASTQGPATGTPPGTQGDGDVTGSDGGTDTGGPPPSGCPGQGCRVRWGQSLGGFTGEVRAIALHPDGGPVVAAQAAIFSCCGSVQHLSETGEPIAEWTLPGTRVAVEGLAVDATGGTFVFMRVLEGPAVVAGTSAQDGESLLVALDDALEPAWASAVPGRAAALSVADQRVYVSGSFEGEATFDGATVNAPQRQAYVVAFDDEGGPQWSLQLPAQEGASVPEILEASTEGVLVSGYGGPIAIGRASVQEAWFVDVDADGAVRGGVWLDGGEVVIDGVWPASVHRVTKLADGRFLAVVEFLQTLDAGGGERTSSGWATALAYYGADYAYESDVAFTGAHGDVLRSSTIAADGSIVLAGKVFDAPVDFGFGPITPADEYDDNGYVRIYERDGTAIDQVALTASFDTVAVAVAADAELIYVGVSDRVEQVDGVSLDGDADFNLLAIERR